MPVARIVALLLILLPIGAYFVVSNVAKAGPSQEARDIANFNPRAMFSDNTPPANTARFRIRATSRSG